MEELDEIIAGCKAHNRKDQEKLYRMFYPAFFALCKKFFGDKHDILSSLNDGMMKVFKNIDQYDASKGEFFNWAYTVVRNCAITYLRIKKPPETEELGSVKGLSSIDSFNPFKESGLEEIYLSLSKLPGQTRAVSSLFYLEGFSIREIAEGMQMKEGTVKWHLSECRTRLKSLFNQPQPINKSA